MRRIALVLLWAGLLLSPGQGASRGAEDDAERGEAGPLRALDSGLREETLVRRVYWPVRLIPRVLGGCDNLRAEQIEVREDEMPVRPDHLDRARLETIHAILIDTSHSMLGRLDRAKTAAAEYIRDLPPGEQVMLATFSDNLLLEMPPTRDRDRLLDALERTEIRSGTALRDALYYTIRYLRSRPERKVIVLMTDGCDSASLPLHPMQSVLELAEETESLSVFPIGVDLPASCDSHTVAVGSREGPDDVLERLARRSGGKLFEIRRVASLPQVFAEIRVRMDQEGSIAYRPVPFGGGPRDRPETRTERKRRVRIRSKDRRNCLVVSAGPAVRVESETSPRRAAPTIVGGRLDFEDWWTGDDHDGASHLDLGTMEIRGWGADILAERSALYSSLAYRKRGRFRKVRDGRVRLEQREFSLRVPPFQTVRETLTSPEALMLYLLENGEPPFSKPDRSSDGIASEERGLTPSWVHGQTLLELREVLGRGLFHYDGYREFASLNWREQHRAELMRALEDANRLRRFEPGRLRALREAIDADRTEPTPAHLQRFIAEWLGDISALDLVTGLERSAANSLLDPERQEHAARMLGAIDEHWKELQDWFPAPTRVRIITPLVPVFDVDRGRVGFYRVILPQVAAAGAPNDLIPVAPLALDFVHRLLDVETGPATAGPLQVRRIDYDGLSNTARRRILHGAETSDLVTEDWRKETSVVRLELGRPDETSSVMTCTVLYRPGEGAGPPVPVCVDFGDPAERPHDAWSRSVYSKIRAVLPECRGSS